MDCTALLTEQLTKIQRLIHQAADGTAALVQRQLAHRELCDRGALHAQTREELVLPLLEDVAWGDVAVEPTGHHRQFRDALALCLIRPPPHPDCANALDGLLVAVQRQLADDAATLVPLLRHVSDLPERRRLCGRIEVRYGRLAPLHGDALAAARATSHPAPAAGPGAWLMEIASVAASAPNAIAARLQPPRSDEGPPAQRFAE
ncbi:MULTISPECIES: hypothetical protein [unclassified Roseateles]|uniref:hypothetical protein n=1 Tax=unclassified Roseateles TaxID=2626991 RepID=UPI000700975F|nr:MULTISPECIES: hypothetical protein [unclassified Roseateles]KQW45527.1 hypothetical protein ASC81_11515 [Pelomonas sp. Root405]KRA72371.1 hypothetical protein ASD88_11515 [Pelomonas sp. Root662]